MFDNYDMYEDVDDNFNIEKSMATTKANTKEKLLFLPKKEKSKGVMINKHITTSIGQRKRTEKSSTEDQVLILNLLRP